MIRETTADGAVRPTPCGGWPPTSGLRLSVCSPRAIISHAKGNSAYVGAGGMAPPLLSSAVDAGV
jgi:hypothetical protein